MKKLLFSLLLAILTFTPFFAQLSWIHTDGPDGGFIPHFISNDDYIFTYDHGFLYRSDTGSEWQKLNNNSPYLTAIHNETIVSVHQDYEAETAYLSISKDNGETWKVNTANFLYTINSIVINENGIFASSSSFDEQFAILYHSTDEGINWNSTELDVFSFVNFKLKTFDNKLYLYKYNSIYSITLSPFVLEEITPFEDSGIYISDFMLWENNIAVTTQERIYISTDQGSSWLEKNVSSSNQNNNLTRIKDTIYAYYNRHILETSDMGESWDSISIPEETFYNIYGFKERLFIASYDKGIHRFDFNTQSLIQSNEGHGRGYIYDLERSGNVIWAACGNGVFKYDIITNTWKKITDLSHEDSRFVKISVDDNGWVIVQNDSNAGFYLSKDNGDSWVNFLGSFSTFGNTSYQVFGNNIFKMNQSQLAISSNNVTSIGFSSTGLEFSNRTYFQKITRFKDQLIFPSKDGISISNNNGQNWTTYTENLPYAFYSLYTTENYLFTLSPNFESNRLDLYVSTDGIEWVLGGEGLSDITSDVQSFLENVFFFESNNKYFVFWGKLHSFWSGTGIYSAETPLGTWTYIGKNDRTPRIIHNDILYAGNHGMWKATIPISLDIVEEKLTPVSTLKIQPNPASENIIIESRKAISNGKLSIFNALGEIISQQHGVNFHNNMSLDISNLQSGIYFIILEDQKSRYTNKLIIKD